MLISTLLTAATIGFSAGVTPGPLQAIFLSYAIKGGWKKTLPAAFAPVISDGPVILIVLLLLNNVSDTLVRILQIGGSLFLLYLAWDSLRAYRHFQPVEAEMETGLIQTLWKATLMNLLSPGPWLFWSLINGPNLLEAWAVSPALGLSYVGAFYGVFILTNMVLILLFSSVRRMGEKVRRAMLLVAALALAGFAVYQFLQGVGVIA
ncbi:LysE family transporter [bacterium]|nr:LysE family transporter [bacterium]